MAEQALWRRYGLEPAERFVELRESATRLRIIEVGAGPPVLLIPGSGGTGPYWAPLVRELSGFRCLMLDRPGWGLSAPIDYASAPYWSQVTAVLAGVLDALRLDRVDVIGASIGGAWGLRLAQSDPDACGGWCCSAARPPRRSRCQSSSSCSAHRWVH